MTHAYLGLAGFDLVCATLGFAVLWGLGLPVRVRDVGLAFFAGWALQGVVFSLALMVGIDLNVWTIVVVVALLVAVCVALRRRFAPLQRPFVPADREPLLRAAAIGGAILLAVALAASVAYAIRLGSDPRWDVWAVWLPKAKAIYYFGGLSTGLGGFTTYGNPFYPPLVPALTAEMFHFMGGAHTTVLPLQESILGVLWVGAVVSLLGPRVPRFILYPVLAMVVLAPDFWTRLSTVLPDQTVGYLLALGAVGGVLWLEERRTAFLVLATLFLGAATLTKEEGFFLGALLAAVLAGAALVQQRRQGLPALALLLGPLLIEPWRFWLRAHDLPPSATQYSWGSLVDPHYLSIKFWRLQYALPRMLDFALSGSNWSLVPPLVVVGLLAVAWHLRVLTAAFAIWIVGGFLGLAAVYWIGTYNVYWYVGYSAHRVVATLPLVGGTVLPLLLALALERSQAARAADVVRERDLGHEHAALARAP